jgi:catechol 2,3-dioxygenase-like lactoylglutathione lyase family enzyme
MILGIDQITYGCAELAPCRKFFDDWGLNLLRETATQLEFESLNGCRVHVAQSNAPGLPAGMEPDPTLREMVWGVADDATLERLQTLLQDQPGYVSEAGQVGCTDPNGLAIRFQVSRKRTLQVHGCPSNTWDSRTRVDQRGLVYHRATPIEVGHVVLFVSELAAAEAFYQSLGFVTSDRYPGRGAFMRCAPRGGHHDLFLLRTPQGNKGLNHVAFTVRDIHEVFGGGLHVSRCGWSTQLGPGRHPISSAYFWYFRSPAGALCEYYADEDELTEAWLPRSFEPGPTVFAEWAVDGGLDGHTRRQTGVQADVKFLTEKHD